MIWIYFADGSNALTYNYQTLLNKLVKTLDLFSKLNAQHLSETPLTKTRHSPQQSFLLRMRMLSM